MGERCRRFGLGCGICAFAPLLVLACACADSHGGSNEGSGLQPHDSTETGNPPVIDVARIALVVRQDDVHVTGEAGAVTPGGVALEVEDLSSGDVTSGTAERNGSFDIQVSGAIDDTYRLRALAEGGAGMASAPVYLYRGGAVVGTSDGGVSSCEQRANIIEQQFALIADSADRSCRSNSDCALATAPGNCPAWTCTGAPIARVSQSAVESAIVAVGDGLCDSFERDGCSSSRRMPQCASPAPVACVDGQCVECAVGDCSGASCATCETPQITWAPTGPVLGDAHILTDCTSLLTIFLQGPQCTTELPCVNAGGHESAAHLQNALGAPEVQAALAADAIFGASEPVGPGVGITIGSHNITVNDQPCSASDCKEAPLAVLQLRATLEEIALEQTCPAR